MKLLSLLRYLLFGVICAYPVVAQTKAPPATGYRITGVVVNSADGSPIPHCHLTPALVQRGNRAPLQFPASIGSFDADDHGRFSIALPSAGMWRLTASARGYVTQAYEEHQSFSSAVVLTVTSPAFDLRFSLSPESVIAGTVLDEAGEPVRNARVSLMALRPLGPDSHQPPDRTRAMVSTDDRGSYEFDELPPGDYRVSVQAQVWYAVAAQQKNLNASDQQPLDPSLDVAYPLTWYPGTSDPAQAETLTLHAGDTRQADFQLLPIPSVHLHILPDAGTMANGRRIQSYPMIEQIASGSGGGFVPVSAHIDPQGGIDVSGLTPGRYEIRMQGPGQAAKPALVDVTSGSVQTLDMSAASTIATISIHVDGISEEEASSVQVSLVDPQTGRSATRSDGGGFILSGTLLRQRSRREGTTERTIEVPPGRYEVVLNGERNLYLTGITAQSAEATGRFVTVPSGNSTLTLHIADGRATLTGFVTMQGKASIGAMVLLIPATLGNPAGLNIIRRDQTNTDGSFDLDNVLPGQYILIAIDRGWQINWNDLATLRGYMMHGVSVNLTSASDRKEDIEAQAP